MNQQHKKRRLKFNLNLLDNTMLILMCAGIIGLLFGLCRYELQTDELGKAFFVNTEAIIKSSATLLIIVFIVKLITELVIKRVFSKKHDHNN